MGSYFTLFLIPRISSFRTALQMIYKVHDYILYSTYKNVYKPNTISNKDFDLILRSNIK